MTASDIHVKRGKCYLAVNNTEAAMKDFSKVINTDRDNEEALIMRANIYVKQNKTQQAIIDFKKAIITNPNNGSAYIGRARMYINQKKYDAALDDLNEAIKIKPDGEAYFLRGGIKSVKNDTSGACKDLKAAANLGYEEAIAKVDEFCK